MSNFINEIVHQCTVSKLNSIEGMLSNYLILKISFRHIKYSHTFPKKCFIFLLNFLFSLRKIFFENFSMSKIYVFIYIYTFAKHAFQIGQYVDYKRKEGLKKTHQMQTHILTHLICSGKDLWMGVWCLGGAHQGCRLLALGFAVCSSTHRKQKLGYLLCTTMPLGWAPCLRPSPRICACCTRHTQPLY